MPRRTVPFEPGCYYHLFNRGNNRSRIFFEADNYLFFLRKGRQYLDPVLDVVAYCLMPTHYHFLVRVAEVQTARGGDETSEVSDTSEVFSREHSAVSEALRRFSISYTKAINKRFDRTGALFEGVYQAKIVEEESYLVSLSRYVHRNPVEAGLVEGPDEWRYSSYRDFVGERGGDLPYPAVVLQSFSSPEAYARFVEDRVPEYDSDEAWTDSLFEQ